MKPEIAELKHRNAALERYIAQTIDDKALRKLITEYREEVGLDPKIEILSFYHHMDSPLTIRVKVTVSV